MNEGKYPWIKFFHGDWRNDPRVGMCSPATRGIWLELVCIMHEMDRTGEISGSYDQLARLCRCNVDEIKCAINELQLTKTADVTECNGNVTVINRRMKRECNERVSSRKRVKKHRKESACNTVETPMKRQCNGDVTVQKSEYRSKNNIINNNKNNNKNNNSAFERFWNQYDKKINRQKCEKKWISLTQKDRDAILSALPDYIKATPDKAYRKHPMTYLNNRGWEDEIVKKKHGATPIGNKFRRNSTTGGYSAYCSKCGRLLFPNNEWELINGSSCCSVEFVPEDPNKDPEWVRNRIKGGLK